MVVSALQLSRGAYSADLGIENRVAILAAPPASSEVRLRLTGMAFLEVKYVKKGRHEREAAKANIKYIQNRRGRDGAKIQRTLFGRP